MAARLHQRHRSLPWRASRRARPGLSPPTIAVDVSCRPPVSRRVHLTTLLPSLHEKPGRTVVIRHAGIGSIWALGQVASQVNPALASGCALSSNCHARAGRQPEAYGVYVAVRAEE